MVWAIFRCNELTKSHFCCLLEQKLLSSENENARKYTLFRSVFPDLFRFWLVNVHYFLFLYHLMPKYSCIACFLSTGRLEGPNISKSLNFGDKWGGGALMSSLTRKYVSDYYITCFLQWWNDVGRLYKQWNNDICVRFFIRNKSMVFREWKCRKIYPIEECFSGFIQILISYVHYFVLELVFYALGDLRDQISVNRLISGIRGCGYTNEPFD